MKMENKDLKIAPELEIIRFGPFDFSRASMNDNETDMGPDYG